MEFDILIPSFGRAGHVATAAFFQGARIVIPESQFRAYVKFYSRDRLIVIDDSRDGSIARKRNAVIEVADRDRIVMMDDDFKSIFQIKPKRNLTEVQAVGLFDQGFAIADGVGAHLWGLNWDSQPLHQRPAHPFSFTKPFYSIMGIVRTEVRFDERLRRLEDVDFWLQHTRRDRVTVRMNQYSAVFRMKEKQQTGGIAEKSDPIEDVELMIRKWGRGVLTVRGGNIWPPKSPYGGQ